MGLSGLLLYSTEGKGPRSPPFWAGIRHGLWCAAGVPVAEAAVGCDGGVMKRRSRGRAGGSWPRRRTAAAAPAMGWEGSQEESQEPWSFLTVLVRLHGRLPPNSSARTRVGLHSDF